MCVVPVCVYYPSVILIPFQSTVLIFIYFSSHLHFCSSSTVIMFSSIFLFHSCVYYIFMFSYLCTVLSNFSLSSNFYFFILDFTFYSIVYISFSTSLLFFVSIPISFLCFNYLFIFFLFFHCIPIFIFIFLFYSGLVSF